MQKPNRTMLGVDTEIPEKNALWSPPEEPW